MQARDPAWGTRSPMYAQKNAKRGICTPCPMHPFPVLSCCLFLAALAPRQSETAVGGVTASSVSSCGMGKESRALGVVPGTLSPGGNPRHSDQSLVGAGPLEGSWRP